MDLILQCFLWIALTSFSTINCKKRLPLFDYPQTYDSSPDLTPDLEIERPALQRGDSQNYGPERTSKNALQKNILKLMQLRDNDVIPRTEKGIYRLANNIRKPENNKMFKTGLVQHPFSSAPTMPDIPEHCKKIGICETMHNYPQEAVDRIIEKLGDTNRHRFKVDVLDEEPKIAMRIAGSSAQYNIDLCNTEVKVMFPRTAIDVHGIWHMIANQDKPLQGFRVEICRSEGGACANNILAFYSGYAGICKQKYIERVMTAVNVTAKALYDVDVFMPSCCSCVASNVGNN